MHDLEWLGQRPVLSDMLYRWLLRIYPRQFRVEYGDDMLLFYRERRRAVGGAGRRRLVMFLLAAFGDAVTHGVAERWLWSSRNLRARIFPSHRLQQHASKSSSRKGSSMSFLREIKQALRNIRSRPGLATVVLLTMAVGIGGNAAIFSVVNAVLLEGLPFRDADELVTLDARAHTGFTISTSVPNYIDWRDRNRSFSSIGAATGWSSTRTDGPQAEVVDTRLVYGEFFETLGVGAALGRTIARSETEQGADANAVLGYRYWQREFGGDVDVIGRTMVLDGRTVEIVGVMPANFAYPASGTDIFLPMGISSTLPWEDRDSGFGMRSVARLSPGVTIDMAMQDLARVGREVRAEFGATTAVPEVRTLSADYLGDAGPQLWILMGAVGFVLLIATVNVGNLLLVRGEDRRSEIAVRTALGATRGAVFRHLVVEGLVLSVLGGIAGIALATALLPVLISVLPDGAPVALVERIRLDGSVLMFSTALMVATGLIFGVLPALRVSRESPAEELRVVQRATDARGKRVRSILVIVEVALATILLVGAGLMLQSLKQLGKADKGFSESGVLTGLVRQQFSDSAQWRSFYTELQTQLSELPGVQSVATSLMLPLSNRSWERRIWPGGVPTDIETGQSVLFSVVSPAYFETLGVPLLLGRTFAPEDRDGSNLVAIIDETMAEMFWPGEDPIGKRVTFEITRPTDGEESVPIYRMVVGVAKNVRHYELESPSRIQVYVPFDQLDGRWGYDLYVLMRASVPPENLASSLRSIARDIDAATPIAQVQALRDYVDSRMSGRRTVSGLLIAFGAVALGLAGIGVFGVISYSVSRQTREIGLRLALGAQARDVVLWVARSGFAIGLAGVSLGLIGAAALSRVLTGMLYQVNPVQLDVYASLGLVLVVLCIAASYLPALRATRIDPVTALRRE